MRWSLRRPASRPPRRVLVLGLDGVPYSLLRQLLEAGELPNLAQLCRRGGLREIDSVAPPVSSVAWASFMTGRNPGGHGIFGFIDRRPNPFQLFLPNAADLRAETIWERLSRLGRRVLVMNLPSTYPPRPINGVLISGFEAPDLKKATFPAELGAELEADGYRLDVDPRAGRESPDAFLEDLEATFDSQSRALLRLLEQEPWDLVLAHVMGTDRLHHFLWAQWEARDPRYAPRFLEFYRGVDELVGKLVARWPEEAGLMILSDHGFCGVKREVYLNSWLEREGYLEFAHRPPQEITDLASGSRAYSLLPGRVYLNLKGREEKGCVAPGKEFQRLRAELAERLTKLADPETGEPVLHQVLEGEQIYCGECAALGPDLVALPRAGYDLKGLSRASELMAPPQLAGMHTYGGAFLYLRDEELIPGEASILEAAATLWALLGLEPPAPDGRSLLA